jgi:hypothetical protein
LAIYIARKKGLLGDCVNVKKNAQKFDLEKFQNPGIAGY